MGHLKKTPNGKWMARYRDENGRPRSRTFERKIDATQFLARTSADIQRGEWIDPASRKDTFDEWAERWWQTTVPLRPTTRRGYWGNLERHVLPYFTGRRIVTIDFTDVEEFIADRISFGLSPKYVRELVSVLSLIMQSAMHSNVRRDNPAAGHKIKVHKTKISQGDTLNMDQLLQLIENVDDHWKTSVWMLAFTGMRPAEMCGLRVKSVDFDRKIVHITETLLPVGKFADIPHDTRVSGPPKTQAGDRVIPLPEWLIEEITSMLSRRSEANASPIHQDDYLFQTTKGNPVNRDKYRQKVIRPGLKAAELDESIPTYGLRHSHASLLIDLGANPLAVMQRMGHSSPSVTLGQYGHLFDGAQEQLTDLLDDLRETSTSGDDAGKIVDFPDQRKAR